MVRAFGAHIKYCFGFLPIIYVQTICVLEINAYCLAILKYVSLENATHHRRMSRRGDVEKYIRVLFNTKVYECSDMNCL
jgi:hypothetical protein